MKTKRIVMLALFTALCYLGTWMHIAVPAIGPDSMIHLGTTVIFILAVLVGKDAAIPAGLGCALFDLFGGHALWTLPTFIVKSLMGYVTGKIAFMNGKEGNNQVYNILSYVAGGIVSLIGYFVFNWIIFKGWQGAVASLLTSISTTVIGAVIAIPLAPAVKVASKKAFKEVSLNK